MVVYHNSSFFHGLLLVAGVVVSVAGGIWISQHFHEEPRATFHSQATDIFKELGDQLLTYERMMDAPYDTFQTSGIITKGSQQGYLDSLPRRPYLGLDDKIQWLKAEDLTGPNPCKRWSDVKKPASTMDKSNHPVLLWHLPVPRITKRARNAPRLDCAGALEARFNIETLFAHLLKSATDRDMAVRISATEADKAGSPNSIDHNPGQIFSKGQQGEADDVWKEEADFMFYTYRLHVVLSAPMQSWYQESAGSIFTATGCVFSGIGYLWILWRQTVERERLEWEKREERERLGREEREERERLEREEREERERLEREEKEERERRALQDRGHELGLQQRGEDVGIIAHELAQPLCGISNCLEILLNRFDRDDLPAEILERDLSDAHRMARRACDSLREIRELAMGPNKRRAGPAVLIDVFRNVADMVSVDSRFHDVELAPKCGEDLRVMASPMALEMVLMNLLRNSADAIRDANRGSVIGLEATKADDGQVKILVTDDGPGISHPDRLFQAFISTKDYGMGLGLRFCKEQIEHFYGSIKGGNRPEGGAWFEITLPVCPVSADYPLLENTNAEPPAADGQVFAGRIGQGHDEENGHLPWADGLGRRAAWLPTASSAGRQVCGEVVRPGEALANAKATYG